MKEWTVTFEGRLDTLAVQNMNELISRNLSATQLPPGIRIVFDLKDVVYISSSFIRICVNVAKQAGQGDFSIINCQPLIMNTFKLSGLVDILNVS